MLKVCSNGVHFQTRFSLYLKHLLQYSTSLAKEKSPSSMVDFLVKSLGFSRQEAITTWSKVRSSKLINSEQNPKLVVDFLKKRGFSNTQVKKVISSRPQLLKCDVDKTLVPKFNALEELGIVGTDLARIVAANASIFKCGLTTKITPMVSFIKSIVRGNEKFISVVKRSYWLMSADVVTRLQPNIDLFRKHGLSDERILNILQYSGDVFGRDTKRLEEILVRVDKELKIPVESAVFPSAVVLLSSMSEKTRQSKYEVFKSFGWTDLDILTMLRKSPKCVALSEINIRVRLEFFMKEMGFKPSYLAERSYVLTYSTEERVLPRYTLLKVLKERKLITNKVGILTAVCSSESVFLKKFVLPYKDELPELCEAYVSRIKRHSGRPMRNFEGSN